MSMAQEAEIEILRRRIASLEAQTAALIEEMARILEWIAARKPGPKPHG